jgi:tetratricopeptide (TPR) repeat protein
VDALDAYADHLIRTGRTEDAGPVCAELYPAARTIYGPDHWRVGRALCWMAMVEQSHCNFVSAESLLTASRRVLAVALGETHPYTISAEDRMGWLYIAWSLPRDAELWFRTALGHCRATFGDDNSATRWCQHNVAMALYGQGRYPEAETLVRRTLAAQVASLGRQNQHVALSSVTLGNICRATGRYAEAETLIRGAIDAERSIHNPVPGSLTALGDLCREQGQFEEARRAYAEAVRARERPGPSGPHPNAAVAEGLVGLGRTLSLMGRAEEAEPLLRRALDIRRRLHMRDSLWIGEAQVALGSCLERLGQHAEAEQLLVAGLPSAMQIPASRDPLVADGRTMLARARFAANRTTTQAP